MSAATVDRSIVETLLRDVRNRHMPSEERVDDVLAALSRMEAEIRADEREACAKAAESRAEGLRDRTRKMTTNDARPLLASAREVAAVADAIRERK